MTKTSYPAFALALIGFLLVGCIYSVETTQQGAAPVAGESVTLTNCKAEPFILQASEGTEVVFKNADGQPHVLYIDNNQINISAKGSATLTARRLASIPENLDYTNNYLCDSALSGAIFIPAKK